MGLKTGGGRDEDDALDTDADADSGFFIFHFLSFFSLNSCCFVLNYHFHSAAYVEKLRAASPKKTRRRTITGAGAAAQSPAESRRVGKGASAKNLLVPFFLSLPNCLLLLHWLSYLIFFFFSKEKYQKSRKEHASLWWPNEPVQVQTTLTFLHLSKLIHLFLSTHVPTYSSPL